jgi:hypothetical protein
MLADMGNRSGTSSKRRFWLLIAACAAITTWLCSPRIDPRFVGTWTDGQHPIVIGSDGYADFFFVQWPNGEVIPLVLGPNGEVVESKPAMAGRSVWGPLRFRTSGDRFHVFTPNYQTTTVSGLLKYFLALLKGERTEELFCEGTVASISDDTMTLDFQLQNGRGIPGPKGSVKYHRVKDAAP